MRTSLLIVATLVGCGADGKTGEPQTVALHAAGSKLLAIQPEGEAWRSLTVPVDGEVSATIPGGPFTVVTVCDEPELFDYYVVFGGTGIEDLDLWCVKPANTVKVSLAAGSNVRGAIGSYPLLGTISWDIPPGTYDITAYDDSFSPPRVEIRRGVSISADTELTFDLATTGTPLEGIAVVTDAMPAESVTKSARLYSAGGTRMTIPATDGGTHVWRVPASALQTGDRQTVSATARAGSGSRTATRTIPNTALSVVMTLPAGLSSAKATFGPPQSATWTSAGDWSEGYFSATDEDFTVMYDAFVTPAYVTEVGQLSSIELPVPASVPGWNPNWKLPNIDNLQWSLSLTRDLAGLDADRAEWDGTFGAVRSAERKIKAREPSGVRHGPVFASPQ